IERAGSKTKTGARLWIVGVDGIKTLIFAKLSRGSSVRLSADLPRVWHEQLASERAVITYARGQPTRRFVRIPGRQAEALDCVVYAFAARQIVNVDWPRRRADLATQARTNKASRPVLKSNWMKR
ncbi:MAG: terminase gpA endonuclease subunit, partial [Paracoccaceae bacterium]